MNDRIQAMRVFTSVVETHSFTRTAELLDLPRATVSNLLRALEDRLGVPLVARTTRRVNITPEGASYYEACARILADIDAAEATLRANPETAEGRLRVTLPTGLAHAIVIPALEGFIRRFPNIRISVGVTQRNVDLLAEGVDCAVQLGSLPDSSLIARQLGRIPYITCASPRYLEQAGIPPAPGDLARHRIITGAPQQGARAPSLPFQAGGVTVQAFGHNVLEVSDEHTALTAALEGLGIAQVSLAVAGPYLARGELHEILADYRPLPVPVSIAYVRNHIVSPRVRAFVDWMRDLFANEPAATAADTTHARKNARPAAFLPQPFPRGTAREMTG